MEPQSNPKTVQTNPELMAFLTHVQSITSSASLQGGESHSCCVCCAPFAPGKVLQYGWEQRWSRCGWWGGGCPVLQHHADTLSPLY